jgi:hypothetical protein
VWITPPAYLTPTQYSQQVHGGISFTDYMSG